MPRALILQIDLEAIGEEGEEVIPASVHTKAK
jgi:hypothetical protein